MPLGGILGGVLVSGIGLSPALMVFFFSSRRRHTRYWRDWSSDVCSSDLALIAAQVAAPAQAEEAADDDEPFDAEIGRASCRERVEISVVAGSLKKKKV